MAQRALRTLVASCLLGCLGHVVAQDLAAIELSVYPEAAPADARSTLTVSATVRDMAGRYVPDGTLVSFTASLGQFREPAVATSGGVARGVLVASNVPGRSKITAAVTGYRAVADIEVEFVADASELRKTASFLDVTGSSYLAYHVELRMIAATGPDRGAHVQYQSVHIEADDLQLDLDPLSVIAYNAVLRVGSSQLEALQLAYNLRSRTGVAVVEKDGRAVFVQVQGIATSEAGRPAGYDDFRFTEMFGPQPVIVARRVVVNPGREALFNGARVYVGANRVLTMPHYALDLTRPGALVSEQMFGVNQNGLVLDLPYYVSLGPRQSNSLRLRSQHAAGRAYTSSRGTTLDWVSRYSDGWAYSGDFTISDLSPDRWGVTFRHNQRFGDRLDGYFLLDSPRHESLAGFAQLSHLFDGFSASLSASGRTALRGTQSTDRRVDLSLETNPIPFFGKTAYHSVGLTASYQQYDIGTGMTTRRGYGLRYRARTVPMQVAGGSLTTGLVLTQLWGRGAGDGLAVLGTVSSSYMLGPTASLSLNYEYNRNQFGVSSFGMHRLSTQFVANAGSLFTSVYAIRSLDKNATTLFGDASVGFSKLWRVGFGYTWDDGPGSTFRDHSFLLGYRLGYREIALRWSSIDRRFGIEVLAAPF
ncbi:MAG: hypothetical protein HRF45_11375 [Fimbriimonadia bacterium]